MINMTLRHVINFLLPSFSGFSGDDCQLFNMTLNSQQVKAGDLFIAVIGHQRDGRQYISNAIEKGANAVLAQASNQFPSGTIDYVNHKPIVYVNDLQSRLSELANYFYQSPSLHQTVVGVTGTNGKTTVTALVAQWGALLGKKTALMGTIGSGILHHLSPSGNTTADAISLQRDLASFVEQGVDITAMEVSSHGLVQNRVKALDFTTVAFTNLSRDHLDYHGDMESYTQAKFLLFSTHQYQHKVINADDDIGYSWLSQLPDAIAVSMNNHIPKHFAGKIIIANNIHYHQEGVTFDITSSWGSASLQSALIGAFNVSNILVALGCILSLGYAFDEVVKTASQLQPVCGRMERFSAPNKAMVIVDYAHTPDALEKALLAAKYHCKGKLWCVFGCGGDRDNGKRPLMAAIAESVADYIIITDDNPRTEDPNLIVDHILAGFVDPSRALTLHQRKEAIEYAISHAQVGDVILVAGKGHEDYQIIGVNKLHYSDRETAAYLLGAIA